MQIQRNSSIVQNGRNVSRVAILQTTVDRISTSAVFTFIDSRAPWSKASQRVPLLFIVGSISRETKVPGAVTNGGGTQSIDICISIISPRASSILVFTSSYFAFLFHDFIRSGDEGEAGGGR